MIYIEMEKEPMRLVSEGHAEGAGEYGENLVCCAVSTLLYTLAEAAEELDLDFSRDEAEGYMELCFSPAPEKESLSRTAFDTVAAGLREEA